LPAKSDRPQVRSYLGPTSTDRSAYSFQLENNAIAMRCKLHSFNLESYGYCFVLLRQGRSPVIRAMFPSLRWMDHFSLRSSVPCLIPQIRQKVIHCYNPLDSMNLPHLFAAKFPNQQEASPVTATAIDRSSVMISVGTVYIEIDRPAQNPSV
jgi:hypothetical protein